MAQSKHQSKSASSSATIDRYVKAGFGDDILPIIPHDAKLGWGSRVQPSQRGKVPGKLNAQGLWTGYPGWTGLIIDDKKRAKFATYPTPNWGLRGTKTPGIDIDTSHAVLAKAIEEAAFRILGPAPVRGRANSERRLLVYRSVHWQWWRNRQWVMPGSTEKHLVEILGRGRQYLVEGIHPSNTPYSWRDGRDLPTVRHAGLTETTTPRSSSSSLRSRRSSHSTAAR
jgi:hypothetical protein